MCGIVGYIGVKDARSIILEGLKALEYRGYDSSGLALLDKNEFKIYKDKGRIAHLCEITDYSFETHVGIGHTRWATHGMVNYDNSHPHISNNKRFILVHNGIIENYRKLKIDYLSDYNFYSETDSEVIVNLIEFYSKKMCTDSAIRKAMSKLEGSYALLIVDNENPDVIYCVKNKTPLILGMSNDGVTIASDIIAFPKDVNKYFIFEDQRIAIIKQNDVKIMDLMGFEIKPEFKDLKLDEYNISKGNYDHYMLKEIEEQPDVIRRIITKYFDDDNAVIDYKLIDAINNSDKINFVACGTSLYASFMGKYFFEKLCGIPTECFVASELVYSNPLMTKKPIFIFVSQSGETLDCITVMKKYKQQGFKIISITNSVESTMAHYSDFVLDICANTEISVASTKSYTASIAVMSILAKAVSNKKTNLKNNLNRVSQVIEDIIVDLKPLVKDMAKKIQNSKAIFYIGRGIDYWAGDEAALKLKEISYINTDSYSSGELKHGTIALIEDGTPVIAIITQEGTNSIIRSNLAEAEARGAKGYVISLESLAYSKDDIIIPNVAHYLTPMVSVVVCQMLAYYVALYKNNDIDKPKNLAKSVTVE
ncbi:MAG: glutamine--fructose-6-phosphate transaminase (isomerizing) [bacterium]|nr:glutamine--fructose-6-phosphate transaminase (isomerizing) [bacterium]